jgi:hypothetical protein
MPATCKLGCGVRVEDAHLRLVERFRVDFLVESFGDRGALKDAILPKEKPVFESEFGEREAHDEALPREEWPVQPARQALRIVSLRMSTSTRTYHHT